MRQWPLCQAPTGSSGTRLTRPLNSVSLNIMNQIATLPLRQFLERSDAWGREEGREVYPKLLEALERTPGAVLYRIDLTGPARVL